MSNKFSMILIAALLATQMIPANPFLDQAQFQVIGRAVNSQGIWSMTWPGVMLKTRFQGSEIGLQIEDYRNSYALSVDGKLQRHIDPQTIKQEIWVRNLSAGEHEVSLLKLTESTNYSGRIGPFLIGSGHWLAPNPPRSRQIEFIGDSWTAALADLSQVRECKDDVVVQQTDISQGFAYKVAQKYQADWQINGMSGMGVNRNWNGNLPESNYRTFYPRVLQFDSTIIATDPQWHPQVYVIGLGTNDFSTALHSGEKWTSDSALTQAYRTEIMGFIAQLRQKSPKAYLVLSRHYIWPKDQVRPLVLDVVKTLRDHGDLRISSFEYQDLELKACLWHPNQADHQKMSQTLIQHLDSIPGLWE